MFCQPLMAKDHAIHSSKQQDEFDCTRKCYSLDPRWHLLQDMAKVMTGMFVFCGEAGVLF